jgi:glycosyltransferase involved in cell wall biosynthesis
MNVWIIQIGEQLPIGSDIRKMRTFFLSEKLCEKGHSVIWWASSFNHLRKQWYFDSDKDITVGANFKIRALKGVGYNKNNSILRFIDHRIIALKFRKKIRTEAIPDIIIASTPSYDLAFEASKFAKKFNIPIIIDVRDKWPDNFLGFFPTHMKFLLKPLLYMEFRMLEVALKQATSIISMSEPMLDWALQKINQKRRLIDKIFYLGYSTHNRNKSNIKNPFTSFYENIRGKFIVLFIGTFGKYHNPEMLIECAKLIKNDEIVFVLAGDGPLKSYLFSKASNQKNVIFSGWANKEHIDYLLGISSLGICPTTIDGEKSFFPNKVFLYWSAGLPVGSAFEGEISHVISNEHLGFNFNNVTELYSGIINLYNDQKLYLKISSNVMEAFKGKYDANIIYESYSQFVEELSKKFNN